MKNSYGCRSQKPFCLCQESSASNCWAGAVGLCQRDGRSVHTHTHAPTQSKEAEGAAEVLSRNRE